MSEESSENSPLGLCACLKSPWKKITKGLKEINACNNCNIQCNSNNVADSSQYSVNNRPFKTDIDEKLKKLLESIDYTKNVQLKDEFNQIMNQIKVSEVISEVIFDKCLLQFFQNDRYLVLK